MQKKLKTDLMGHPVAVYRCLFENLKSSGRPSITEWNMQPINQVSNTLFDDL